MNGPSLVNVSKIVKLPLVNVSTIVKKPQPVNLSVVKVSILKRFASSVNMDAGLDNKTKSEWIVIGISGVTCGGKTTLANRLLESLAPVHVFHQDKYFYPDDSPRHVRCADIPHNNYDILSALDMGSFYRDVVSTMRGQDRAHASSLETRDHKLTVPGRRFLVMEGFTALNCPPINELCDLRYYFVLEYSACVSRRVLRLYEPPDVDGYFDLCVWPEHLKYRAQIEKDKRVTLLDGAAPGAFETVIRDIRALAGLSEQP